MKPLLHQRSYSVDRQSLIDNSVFTHEDKQLCMRIMELEEAKIRSYLQLQAFRKEQLQERLGELQSVIEIQRVHAAKRGESDEAILQESEDRVGEAVKGQSRRVVEITNQIN